MRQENRRVSNRERGSMARFKVTESARSREGRILGLYGPSFGYRTTKEVISDLLAGRHVYFVREGSYESQVRVIEEGEGRTIVSTRDIVSPNNLQNLRSFY